MRRALVIPAPSLLLALVCAGCAQSKPVIKTQHFDFAGARAQVRDFPPGAICEAEPRFLLDEISSVNGLLNRFLLALPREGAEWTDQAIALVEDGATRLPPVIELHGKSLKELGRCEFSSTGAWPALLGRGRELIHQTRTRLDSAPEELAELRKKKAREAWNAERLAAEQSGKRACPARPRGAVVAFAWREGSVTTWLFCDGARVTRDGNQKPQLEPPPEETRGKKLSESAYLTAAGRYPGGAVLTAPEDSVVTAW